MFKFLWIIFLLPLTGLGQAVLLNQNGTVRQGETKIFAIKLVKGKTYDIHAEQIGIDFALVLIGPGNDSLRYKDSTNGNRGPEIITWTALSTGNYKLHIIPLKEPGNEAGRFSLAVRETVAINKDTYLTGTVSPAQMREDLEVFKKIREQANSGLYRYRTKAQIDSIYRRAFAEVERPLSILKFNSIIMGLNSFEGSSHNWAELPFETPNDLKFYLPADKGYFPFELKYIEGNMVINTGEGEISPGSRVRSINGVADTTIMKALYMYRTTDGYNMSRKKISSANDKFGQRYQAEFGSHDRFVVQYSLPHSSVIQTKTVKSVSRAEAEQHDLHRYSLPFDNTLDFDVQGGYKLGMFNDSTAMLNVRQFNMGGNPDDPAYIAFSRRIDSFFYALRVHHVKNLVVDIRQNPGGTTISLMKLFSYIANSRYKENTLAYINFDTVPMAKYFKWASSDSENQRLEQQQFEKDLLNEFSIKESGRFIQAPSFNPFWSPDSNSFKGKVVLLIDEYVGSAASHFASLAKAYSNATIVGMETGGGYYGHNGHIGVQYCLPNSKIVVAFSIVFVEQDAPKMTAEPFGRGVIPDYEVSQTLDDFLKNRDTQLEYVLHHILAR